MKKRLLLSLIMILCIPLICMGVDVTHKVGVMIVSTLTVKNIQNLSFGKILPVTGSVWIGVKANGEMSSPSGVTVIQDGHPGIIKITGYGTVAIASTPPTVLTHVSDSSKTLPLTQMKIVYSDGSAISNMNNVEITNSLELKTIGGFAVTCSAPGEYTGEWPITVNYTGVYAEEEYEP